MNYRTHDTCDKCPCQCRISDPKNKWGLCPSDVGNNTAMREYFLRHNPPIFADPVLAAELAAEIAALP